LRTFGLVLVAEITCTAPGVVAQEPLILLDAAHHNVSQPASRASLVQFLVANGYRSRELYQPLAPAVLRDARLVILEGPLSAQNALPEAFTQEQFDAAWSRPVRSAFTAQEITALHDWVNDGGGLLLVFDHMPVAGASSDLAAAFGFEVTDGYAVDVEKLSDLSASSVVEAASVVFYRDDGTLATHSITAEQGRAARIDSIATWTGSAFRVPSGGRSLLTLRPSFISLLPDTAWAFSASTGRQEIGGWSQGAIIEVGQGRVAVFAELGILVSPDLVDEAKGDAEAHPQVQNPQLLLNVLRWLSG